MLQICTSTRSREAKPMTNRAGVFRGLDTVLLRVRDIDRAKAWYQEKLGFAHPYFDPVERLAVFDFGGTTSLTLWELKAGENLCPADHAKPFPIFSVVDAHQTWNPFCEGAEWSSVRWSTAAELPTSRSETLMTIFSRPVRFIEQA